MFKQGRRHLRNFDTVVDNEDHRALRMPRVGRGNFFLGEVLVGAGWQIKGNRRSLSDSAFRLYPSAGLMGKTIYLR